MQPPRLTPSKTLNRGFKTTSKINPEIAKYVSIQERIKCP